MLVLPRIGRPASRSLRDHGGVVRRHPALEDPRPAGGGQPTRGQHVLDRDRHPVQGAGEACRRRAARRMRRPERARRRCPPAGRRARRRRPRRSGPGGPGSARRSWSRPRPARRPAPRRSSWSGPGLAHCSSPRIRGTANRCCSDLGSARQRLLGGQAGHHDVIPEHVGQRHRVRGRRHVVAGDALDGRDRLEDHRQLGRQVVELGVVEVDARERRQVRDLVARDFGHGRNPRRLLAPRPRGPDARPGGAACW